MNFKTEDAMKYQINIAKKDQVCCSHDREQWIIQAIEKARQHPQKTLLQLIIPCSLSSADPWQRLPSCHHDEPFIAWHDPNRKQSLLARGQIFKAEFQGPGRFEKLHQEQQRLAQLRIIHQDQSLPQSKLPPLAFAGFAFASDKESKLGPWQSWPDSLLVIPEEIVIRGPDQKCKIIINLWIDKELPQAFVIARRIEDIEEDLGRAAPRSSPSISAAELGSRVLEDQQQWQQRVDAVASAVRAQYLDKVVLARAVEFSPGEQLFDRNKTLLKLRQQHPSSISFAVEIGGQACFLGSTPETLIHLQNGVFETHALAGTTKRSQNPWEDQRAGQVLLESRKDLREQGIVTEALTETLRPLSKQLQVANKPSLRRLPKVQHLETRISGQLLPEEHFQSSHLFTLLSHMHPTPAVGGHPFGRARQWLENREALHRGWYAGPIGWVDGDGNGTFAVAIRSALLTPNKAVAYAGAGIVADSEAVLEWQETAVKFETIRSALTLRENPQARG
jgi:isochorismate synthase